VQFLSYNDASAVGAKQYSQYVPDLDGSNSVRSTFIWCNSVAPYLLQNNADSFIDSIKMQTDNNLVAYGSKNELLWASYTEEVNTNRPGYFLELLDNGNLLMLTFDKYWKEIRKWNSFDDR
jgi:hypothetical protein